MRCGPVACLVSRVHSISIAFIITVNKRSFIYEFVINIATLSTDVRCGVSKSQPNKHAFSRLVTLTVYRLYDVNFVFHNEQCYISAAMRPMN